MPARGTTTCSGPVSRRSVLEAGAFGLVGLGLPQFLSAPQALQAAAAEKHKSVIFVWLPGGPPHMEMYDMKPEAPSEFRGDFNPIDTNVPGLQVSEHMPLHAKIADKYNVVRSIAHEFADHGGGHKKFMTGRDPILPFGFVNDYPAIPSVVAKCLEDRNVGVPNYVSGTDGGRDGIDVFSFGSAYLGPSTHPFSVVGNPAAKDFTVQNLSPQEGLGARMGDRTALLQGLDTLDRRVDRFGTMSSLDQFNQRAMQLISSDKAKRAFDLSLEPQSVRDRYGIHQYGQRALMARRLVESGVSWVTMVMENPVPPGQDYPVDVSYNWDSHAVNCHIFTDTKYRLQFYDQAVTALIEDLYERGMDKDTLLIVTGEFGRTPRLSYANGRPGRDHWPQAMSLIVAGGGMRTGQIIGSTNSKGEFPKDRPLVPNDLWATVLRHLGIDSQKSFMDHRGRPMPILTSGEPISELT